MQNDIELMRGRGRPNRLSTQQLQTARDLWLYEGESVRNIADFLKVSHMTVWRALIFERRRRYASAHG
jgi:transposase